MIKKIVLILLICFALSFTFACGEDNDDNKQNEAVHEYTVTFVVDGEKTEVKVAEGEKAKKPTDPEKVGFVFMGWYVGEEEYDFGAVSGDLEVTAKFEEEVKEYTVKFVVDGKESEVKVAEGEKASKPADPVKEGFAFLGWYVNEEAYDFEKTVNSDLELIAKFEKDVVVSFIFQQEMFVGDNQIVELYINEEKINASEYTVVVDINGFEINGNYITAINEGIYQCSILYNDKEYEVGNITVSKKVKPEKISLTFNVGVGVCKDLPTEYVLGEPYLLPIPVSVDYQFCGWIGQDGNKYYELNDSVTEDLELTAKWMLLESDESFMIYDCALAISKLPNEITLDDESKLNEVISIIDDMDKSLLDDVYNYYLMEKYQQEFNEQKELVEKINNNIDLLQLEKTVELADEIANDYIKVPELNKKYIEKFDSFCELLLQVNDLEMNINSYIMDQLDTYTGLPTELNGISVSWTSSDDKLFVVDGEVGTINKAYQSHVKKDLIVYMNFNFKGIDIAISKKTKVSAIVHEDIPVSPVAAYINIGAMSHYTTYNGRDEVFSQRVKDTLDLAYYSFAVPTSRGAIQLQGSFDEYYDEMMELKNHNTRVLLVLGGSGTSKAFSDIAADDAILNTFINNLVDIVLKYNFDGVDIDWEYPGYESGRDTNVDKANYVTMFALLRAKLNAVQDKEGTDFILTSAIPGTSWGIARYDVPGLNKYLDYVNIMSYDLNNGQKATHLSPLYTSSKDGGYGFSADYGVKTFTNLGFDKSKLILGAATYGKAYKVTGTGITIDNVLGKTATLTQIMNVPGSFASGTIYYYAISQLLLQSDYKTAIEKSGDDIVCSYIYNQKEGIFITYESDQVFKAKYEYALDNGIGIMCWSMPEDATDTYINSIYYVKNK